MSPPKPPIICLMGPTASGKTPLAVQLVQQFPCDIISVDSAMVYRGMDIGTAKPDAETLKIAPHRLIDLVDPTDSYSAGHFREDALREINQIISAGRIPLLVGGTMMYFRVLSQGLAALPRADQAIRASLQTRIQQSGLANLHAELTQIDPVAAAKINPNDSQRIQRALEVYQLTGKPISQIQAEKTNPLAGYRVYHLAIAPADRAVLHERIAKRFDQMWAHGFLDEVLKLYAREDMTADLPSIRSVGYRQVWDYLAGTIDEKTMREQVIAATRQLAKRQLTWLRSWPDVIWFDSESQDLVESVAHWMREVINQ